jgi:hypothetical protein
MKLNIARFLAGCSGLFLLSCNNASETKTDTGLVGVKSSKKKKELTKRSKEKKRKGVI